MALGRLGPVCYSNPMNPFAITGPLLAPLFGIADEVGTFDETSLVTVNVKLDQIFRLHMAHQGSLVAVAKGELEKLLLAPGWEARELKIKLPEFRPAEDGIPEEFIMELNDAPGRLIASAVGRATYVLLHSPMLRYKAFTLKQKKAVAEVYTKILLPVATTAPAPPARKPIMEKAKRKRGK